jgi:hypothetical protein
VTGKVCPVHGMTRHREFNEDWFQDCRRSPRTPASFMDIPL